ncbi:MAG: AAA family ATPase, partial [Candidatus Methanomethylophilaceae archaeon]|nr:AAA family ATPase [Candidatus Methanomethylophilaceae archaeon]
RKNDVFTPKIKDSSTCRIHVTVDFRKSKNYIFNLNLIHDGLINKALLIGANGSGKTNIGRAIFDIVYTLTDRVADNVQVDDSTFINGDSDLQYAEFSYGFISDGSRFRYTYKKTAPIVNSAVCRNYFF